MSEIYREIAVVTFAAREGEPERRALRRLIKARAFWRSL